MNFEITEHKNGAIARLVAIAQPISSVEDALDLLGNASYLGAHKIIVRQEQLSPAFFDLSTKLAGEILQKFSNYRMKLAIVGDFRNVASKSLRDFIYESNHGGHIMFVSSDEEAELKV